MDWSTVDLTGVVDELTGTNGIITELIPVLLPLFAIILALRMIPKLFKSFAR